MTLAEEKEWKRQKLLFIMGRLKLVLQIIPTPCELQRIEHELAHIAVNMGESLTYFTTFDVRDALSELEEEGYVVRGHARGVELAVKGPKPPKHPMYGDLGSVA